MKRVTIVMVLCALLVTPVAASAATAPSSNVVADAEWTLSAQLADGAIAHYTDRLIVFKDGQEKARVVGARGKEAILREFEPHIAA